MSAPEIRGLQKSFTRDEYTSPEIFAAELETIFSKHWCYVGRADKLSHIGDRMVCNVGSESILIVRNRESQLRAYFNVCQPAVRSCVTRADLAMAQQSPARTTRGVIRWTEILSAQSIMKKSPLIANAFH